MKVVFDSSVLFSAFLQSSTSSKRLLGLARTSALQICLSEQILEETAAALFSKAGQFDYSESEVLEYRPAYGSCHRG